METPRFAYPFISHWGSGLLPLFVNNAAGIIRVQVPAWMFVFICVECVTHTHLLIRDSASTLPGKGQAVFHFMFPEAKCEGSTSSPPSPTRVSASLFDSSPLRGCEVHCHCGFICISLMATMLSTFTRAYCSSFSFALLGPPI